MQKTNNNIPFDASNAGASKTIIPLGAFGSIVEAAKTPSELLIFMGFCPDQLGFAYLSYGVALVYESRKNYYSDKLDVLSAITSRFNVSKSRAVDNMQHAISGAWNGAFGSQLRASFPTTVCNQPKPMDFICGAATFLTDKVK